MESRITEIDPPRKLVFTWGGSSDVTFELEPAGDKVLLTVVHRRLPDRSTMLMRHRRLARASRHAGRPRDGRGAGAVLGRLSRLRANTTAPPGLKRRRGPNSVARAAIRR